MATVTLYTALDMETAQFWAGDVVSATSTQIIIADGLRESVITGEGFVYNRNGIIKGTIHEFEQTFDGSLEYTFTGLNTDAKAAYDLYEANDPQGLLALALNGDDTITGSKQADVLYGFDGADRVSGGDGDDVVDGGIGRDYLVGNRGDDTLRGGADNDRLIGAVGNDHLLGGEGGDLFIFTDTGSDGSNPERDTIGDWQDGSDRIKFAADLEGEVSFDYSSGTDTLITFGDDGGNQILVTGSIQVGFEDIFFA